MSRGCLVGRSLRYTIGVPLADTAAFQGLAAADERCADGCVTVKLDDSTLWVMDTGSSAVAGPSVIVPTNATGRFLSVGSGGSVGVGAVNMLTVRGASTANIADLTTFTVAGVDGLTYAEGERILLKDQASADENGPYRCGAVAGGTCALTRVGEADASVEVTAGMMIYVSEGTAAGNEWFFLSTDDAIVLDTTNLTFVQVPSLVDLSSTANALGASLIGIEDPGTLIAGTDVEAALVENRAAIDASEADLVTHRPGVPMQLRLRMLGAPGAIVAADTVTIGADVYEFRADTPPSGGTAGRIWIYQGANSAASRANFINAVNNVTDAPNITYDGAVSESMIAAAGVTTGDVIVQSATAVGGTVAPSATATACSETLTTATDIWDAAAMRGGYVQSAKQAASVTLTLTAADVAKGDIQAYFDFTPTHCTVVNRNRPQDEAYTIAGNAVSVTLGGGAGPNNQAADVIDVTAWA